VVALEEGEVRETTRRNQAKSRRVHEAENERNLDFLFYSRLYSKPLKWRRITSGE